MAVQFCDSLLCSWGSVEEYWSFALENNIDAFLGVRVSCTSSLCIALKRETALWILHCALGWASLSDFSGGVQRRCLGQLLWVTSNIFILKLFQFFIQWVILLLLLLHIVLLLNGTVLMKTKLLIFLLIYIILLDFMLVTHFYDILNLFAVVFIIDALGDW